MNDNYYLICLNGLDSLQFRIVDNETFSWVVSGQDIPESVKDDILYSRGMNEEELDTWISEHNDNDRALIVTSIETFYSILDLLEYLKNNEITITDEYRGVIY